jgi:uncharacterized protein (TIGR03437 family)
MPSAQSKTRIAAYCLLSGVSAAAFAATCHGPEGAMVYSLAADPRTPSTLYAGTGYAGVFKSTDAGATWSFAGLLNQIVNAVAIAPSRPSTIYAGTIYGVFKSADGALTWTATGTHDPRPGLEMVEALAVDPTSPDIVYAASYRGLFKTTDGGGTWTAVTTGPPAYTNPNTVAIDPARPATIYVAAKNGIYGSTDAGAHWQVLTASMPGFLQPTALVVDPAGTGTVFAGSPSGVFRSTDAGATWPQVLKYETVTAMAMVSGTVYASVAEGVYRSTDGGAHWTLSKTKTDSRKGGEVQALAVSPAAPTNVYAGTYGAGVLKSVNQGATWVHPDRNMNNTWVRAIAIDPAAPRTLYAGTNLGVLRSTDGGANWTDISAHLPNTFIEALAIEPSDPPVLYAATSGLYKTTDGGATWVDTGVVAHVWDVAVAPTTPAAVYIATNHGLVKSTNHGVNWTVASSGLTTAAKVLAIDSRNPATIYAGTMDGVFKTTDGGGSWTKAKNSPDIIEALAVDPASGTVYAGDMDGRIYRSADGGVTWTRVSPLPIEQCTGGIDDQECVALAVDPRSPGVVYAGNDYGVFRSADSGEHWDLLNNGVMNTLVRSLAIVPGTGGVYAGTYGGIFAVPVESGPPAPVLEFRGVANAASYERWTAAPDSWAALFGERLAAELTLADAVPLPLTLAGVTVHVTDRYGVRLPARLAFVHPRQVNFLVPAEVSPGWGWAEITTDAGTSSAPFLIDFVAPGIFSANSDAKGVAAAVAIRINASGAQTVLPVFQCPAGGGSCTGIPIDLGGAADQVILMLYGTGIRGLRSPTWVSVGWEEAEVLGAAAQGQYAGLDQINVRLPRSLAGRGEVEVWVSVEGKAANMVTVTIR